MTTMAVSEGQDPFLSQDSLLQEARPWTVWSLCRVLLVGTTHGGDSGRSHGGATTPHLRRALLASSLESPSHGTTVAGSGQHSLWLCCVQLSLKVPGGSAFPWILTTSCSATWRSLALRLAQGNAAPPGCSPNGTSTPVQSGDRAMVLSLEAGHGHCGQACGGPSRPLPRVPGATAGGLCLSER